MASLNENDEEVKYDGLDNRRFEVEIELQEKKLEKISFCGYLIILGSTREMVPSCTDFSIWHKLVPGCHANTIPNYRFSGRLFKFRG